MANFNASGPVITLEASESSLSVAALPITTTREVTRRSADVVVITLEASESSLSVAALPITTTREVTRRSAEVVVVLSQGDLSPTTQSVTTLLGRLIGESSTTSTDRASGVFSLREQAEAKRRNTWPL